jgi:hypothetical protein
MVLEEFVLFSSAAGVLGAPGQSSHAAANAYLGSLACRRRAEGLSGLCIAWGVWSGIGAAARKGVDAGRLPAGLYPLEPDEGLQCLERLLKADRANVTVLPADWDRFVNSYPSSQLPPLFRDVPRGQTGAGGARAAGSALWRKQLHSTPAAEQRACLQRLLAEQVRGTFGWPADRSLEVNRPLAELGLDSLMGVGLTRSISLAVDVPLPSTLLFDHPTLERLTDYLVAQVLGL